METYALLMDRETQYYYDVISLKVNQWMQWNPNKNPCRLFYRNEPGDSKRYIEI